MSALSGRTVFVTRKFPPSIGGMQTLSADVWRALEVVAPGAQLLAHRGSNASLPLFLPRALLRLGWLRARDPRLTVLCGDALLYCVLGPLLRVARVPHATMVMGLDVTWPSRPYQRLVGWALRRAPRVVAISTATAEQVRLRGVPPERLEVVRLAVSPPPPWCRPTTPAAALRELVGLQDEDRVLVTLGRLVERKGVAWFVEQVLPALGPRTHLVVAGTGPHAAAIEAAARAPSVSARCHLLGRVDDDHREVLLRGADLFVQPNVPVAGDMEGFGLVTLEAALRCTVVVASDLEGLRDAVVDRETGVLVPPGDAGAWVAAVRRLLDDPGLTDLAQRLRDGTRARFGTEQMGRALVQVLAGRDRA